MEELKKSFKEFLKEDAISIIIVLTKLSLGFLFFISLYMPFIYESTIIGGKTSLAAFPGTFLFEAVIFISIPAYFYFYLVKNYKFAKTTMTVQAISALLIYIYGISVFRIGFPDSATAGIGKHLSFVTLLLILIMLFAEKRVISLIDKYILKKEEPQKVEELEHKE